MALAVAPNPSMGQVRMTYGLRSATRVTIEIFNAAGSLVRRLEEGPRSAGQHAIQWDGRDDRGNALASGIYLPGRSRRMGSKRGVS